MSYSDKVLDHARNPRHVGFIEDADGVGVIGDPTCGDFVVMTIRVRDGHIADVRYQIRGCGAAIATCSAAAELVFGQPLEIAETLTDEDVVRALDGLPPEKLHCSNLAASALHAALDDYRRRQKVDLHDWRSLYAR